MTERLTDQQLDEIEGRAASEHLTPGPWDLAYEACDCGGDYPCGHGPYVTGVITPVPTSIAADRCKRTGEEPRDYDFHRGEIGDFTEADWALMVAAREDVPVLLAEIRRQRAELKRAQENYQAYRIGAEGAKQMLADRVNAVTDLLDQQELAARGFEVPLPEWVTVVRRAIDPAAAAASGGGR